jgi:arylsulfatase A-like enzyme
MNRLSKDGMLFTQAYAEPLCSPTRAALMTGKYPTRFAMHQAITGQSKAQPTVPSEPRRGEQVCWPESMSQLPPEELTIAEVLQESGYNTWFLGKWHLGNNPSHWPDRQGFGTIFGVGGAGPSGGYFAPNSIPALKPGPPGEYVCERLTNEACRLIENAGDAPFFMYLSHFNVHSPYEARVDDVERFAAKIDHNLIHQNPVMAAMLYAMDESLGRILDKLEEQKLAEDTWLFFISDNGGVHWNNMQGEYAKRFPVPVTSNAPLRGGKACFYEGGVRIPMIIRKPGTVPADSKCHQPVHAIDIFPTLADIAGIDKSQYSGRDGISLLPAVSKGIALERKHLFCHFPRPKTLADTVGGSFVREGDYKLIRLWFGGNNGMHAYELYDLSNDIGEQINLAHSMPEKVKAMSQTLDQWLKETNALVPQFHSRE